MSSRGRGGRLKPRAGFQKPSEEMGSGVSSVILKQARKSGQLNLSNRQLTTVPDSVWKINEDVPQEAKTVSLDNTEDRWWDQVDLTKLILASNSLSELSEDISKLPALTVLDAHDNQLTSVPQSLSECSQLRKLMLGHNKLQSLPSCVINLVNLKILHLEHNQLKEFPTDIGNLLHLEELDVSENELECLPNSIGYLTECFKLNVSNNRLKTLPREVGLLKSLRVLEASGNALQSLPDDLGHLEHLELLYLRQNKLSHLPKLEHCKKLKEIHANNNAIMGLQGESLHYLPELVLLNLQDNKLSKLPAEITELTNLERLDLINNDISELPYEVGTMQKLKVISLDGNPMKGVRRDIIMRGTAEIKKYLASRMSEPVPEKVTITSGGTSSQPGDNSYTVDAHTVSSTKSLDYSNKRASSIPCDIWEALRKSNVTSVNIGKNLLTQLPQNLILAVDTLGSLNISFNRLTALSSDIGLYLQLTDLDLRNNQLSQLPSEIVSLQKLMTINISCNRFAALPKCLNEMKSLENLLASDNQIQVIDVDGLKCLEKLACLDLQNNSITEVPPQLANINSLRSLSLGGNPCRNPRPAILAKGSAAVLEYLKGRIPTT